MNSCLARLSRGHQCDRTAAEFTGEAMEPVRLQEHSVTARCTILCSRVSPRHRNAGSRSEDLWVVEDAPM